MMLRRSSFRACARLMGPMLGAILFVAAATSASAQGTRHSAPQMQRGPSASQMQRQPAALQAQQQRAPAQGQMAAADFRTALQPHGRWQHHSRWGDVWAPANRPRNWRPYTAGRWAYTDDWGWYWLAGAAEASWGWVTYHYGRWVFDPEFGWVWVPGTEWSPGWVQWRYGHQYVGWAPLPPDEIVVEYRDAPDVWIFVRESDFVFAPSLAAVILPVREFPVFLRETAVVNTAVAVSGGFAVNPGIPPALVASEVGRPVPTYSVRPRVLAGTAQVPGAMQVRAQDLRNRAFRGQVMARQTQNVIRPSANVPQLKPLAAGERGRLGDHPPRMAHAAAPTTTGRAPTQQQQAQPQQTQRQQPSAQQPRQQQGAQQQPSSQQTRQVRPPAQQRERQGLKREPQTQGGRAAEQRQQQVQQPRTAQPQQNAPRAAQPQRSGQAERRALEQQRHAAPAERRGAPAAQARPQPAQPGAPHATEGRGHGAGAAAPRPAVPQRPQPSPGATVGRGGGGPPQAAPQQGPAGGAPRGGPPGGGGHAPGGPHR